MANVAANLTRKPARLLSPGDFLSASRRTVIKVAAASNNKVSVVFQRVNGERGQALWHKNTIMAVVEHG